MVLPPEEAAFELSNIPRGREGLWEEHHTDLEDVGENLLRTSRSYKRASILLNIRSQYWHYFNSTVG